ncbi:MAG TPA: 2-hydroxyacid dehydrogenase [Acidimicrobiales bacterium]|nr:2-hydroxyacid dehydrogenase [Acidimicrobiales bacterium]
MAPNPDRLVVSVSDVNVAAALRDIDGVDVVVWDMSGPSPVASIDVLVPPFLGGSDWITQLSSVRTRLVQSPMLGYDGMAERLPAGIVYANAASVHETSTSELALALILALQRGIPDYVRAAERGEWKRGWRESLADRRVLLVGYGGVGRAIAQRLLPFEVVLTRVAHHERRDEIGEIYGIDALPELLPSADIVIIAVPLNDSTTHLVDDAFLSRMSDGSMLVNIARGQVADTNALVDHARSGRLRLALDVTDPEPLPEGHPLFALENVLISPHVGGATSAAIPRLIHLVKEQIDRLRNGEEPLNVVIRT